MANITSLVASSVSDLVKTLQPEHPVYCVRHHAIDTAARWFGDNFPGEVIYAVKSNPEPAVLHTLYTAGLRHFDVASLTEVKLVADHLPKDVSMYFMHPVKSREAIHAAYFEYGVRDFSLDSFGELQKILAVTKNAPDLGLHVRVAIPNEHAVHDLSGKFGIQAQHALKLLRQVRKVSSRMGVCFHVGSQCMHPSAYGAAMRLIKSIIAQSKIKLDVLDIGGGFPSIYPGLTPLPLSEYMREIKESFAALDFGPQCKLWCEPGRALVAEAGSMVVRVELRKAQALYINDGTYGSLFDAGFPGMVYPVRLIRPEGRMSSRMVPYSFYGPTCDSMDAMKGPFYLPSDIKEGDYIEIGQLGAYGSTLRTKFNGFDTEILANVDDKPQMSMFGLAEEKILQRRRKVA